MEESTAVFLFCALGLALLAAGAAASNSLSMQISLFAQSASEGVLCAQVAEGRAFLSQPTSNDFCKALGDMPRDSASLCYYLADAEKSAACKSLVGLADARTDDCLTFLVEGGTHYPAGEPQANEWCKSITSE